MSLNCMFPPFRLLTWTVDIAASHLHGAAQCPAPTCGQLQVEPRSNAAMIPMSRGTRFHLLTNPRGHSETCFEREGPLTIPMGFPHNSLFSTEPLRLHITNKLQRVLSNLDRNNDGHLCKAPSGLRGRRLATPCKYRPSAESRISQPEADPKKHIRSLILSGPSQVPPPPHHKKRKPAPQIQIS